VAGAGEGCVGVVGVLLLLLGLGWGGVHGWLVEGLWWLRDWSWDGFRKGGWLLLKMAWFGVV
jgi:hypothetical protein